MLEVVFSTLIAATLLVVLIFTIRLFRGGRNLLALTFFAFAVACSLLSALYWAVYDLLRPETRMPFAANEICEWAMFLLLGTSLRAVFPKDAPRWRLLVPTALFLCANTALWIAWSGEWVQDILTGIALGYFFCVLVSCLWQSGAMPKGEWIGLGAAAVLLIAAQTLTFFVDGGTAGALDTACGVLLLTADLWLILRAIFAIRQADFRYRICRCCAASAWSIVSMYMSSGAVYLIALALMAICYPLMLRAFQKEVDAA